MRRFFRSGLCGSLAVLALGCGSGSLQSGKEMTSAVVGMTGGMVASSDGALQVVIPAGALSSDVMVTVEPIATPGAGSVGKVYEIGPTGTQFATPVTLTLDYSGMNLAGTDPSMLRVATYAAGSWQILSGASVDMQGMTVSGTTTHLSPYGITTAAAGAMCATVSGGVSCGGGVDGGVGAPVSGGLIQARAEAAAPRAAAASPPRPAAARRRGATALARRAAVARRRAACPAPAPTRPTPARRTPARR